MTQKQTHILLIDVNPSAVQTTATLLTARGYALRCAPDASSALMIAQNTPPDLILLGVDLSTHSYDTYQQLKTTPHTRDVPIILLYSAAATAVDKARGLAQGATDYITAPFYEVEVLHRVAQQLQIQRLERASAQHHAELTALRAEYEETERALAQMNVAAEHWRTEQTAAWRASQAMLRYFLSRSNDGYVIINDKNEVVYANAPARLYLDLRNETPAPPPTFMQLAKKQYHCEPQMAWDIWPKKIFINGAPVDLYLVRPESSTTSTFWLKVNLLDVPVPAGMTASSDRIIRLEDVTEHTLLQDELNKFHAFIGHKLRTPLVPIYSGLQYLANNIDKLSTEEISNFLTNALTGAERLYHEIEDIVQYLNAPHLIKTGGSFALTEFPALITTIAQDLKMHTVTTTIDPSLSAASVGLSSQSLALIMWELLENSQKFHPTHTPTVELYLTRRATHEVRIQVVDNGLTLSPTQLAQIWRPYYQGEKFTTGQVAGMGLGLPLVTIQVWGIGGTYHAHNRENGPGVVIYIQIPLAEV